MMQSQLQLICMYYCIMYTVVINMWYVNGRELPFVHVLYAGCMYTNILLTLKQEMLNQAIICLHARTHTFNCIFAIITTL